MAVTARKSILFLGGGAAAAAVVAYFAGAFYPELSGKPDTIARTPGQEEAVSKAARLPGAQEPEATTDQQATAPEPVAPATPEVAPPEPATPEPQAAASAPTVIAPSFDVVRVESNGSIVIAGKASPNATVDLLVGSRVIGSATAGPDGDFAVVLEDPLKPGDYQIVLRATGADKVVAMSVETAVVSVPETPDGQVLALVEEPGKPSQMITLPAPRKPAETVSPPAPEDTKAADAPQPAETPSVSEQKPGADAQAAATPAPLASPPAPEPAPAPTPVGPTVRVEAVEIDGRKIFVAGTADPGRTVRGYANEILLGDAKASPDGSYLIEADRDLPVGDYIIRVDALEPDGVKVAARAAVPFEREPGETIAAVAAPQPEPEAKPKPEAVAPAAQAAAPDTKAEAPVVDAPATEQPAATSSEPAPAATAPAAGETSPSVASGEQPAVQQPAAEQPVTGQAETSQTETSKPATGTDAPPVAEAPAEVSPPTADQPVAKQPAVEAPAASPTLPADNAGAPPEAVEPQAAPEPNVTAAPAPDLPTPPSADGVTEVLAPKLQSAGSAVIIRRGDSLWRISRRVYGRGVRYSTIYLANQTQIEDPNRIWPGQVFKVPEKSDDGKANADFSTMGDRITTIPKEGVE